MNNKFYNKKTKKYVQRLRPTTVGQTVGKAIGQSKGKAIGKAIGKAKGKAQIKRSEQIDNSLYYYYNHTSLINNIFPNYNDLDKTRILLFLTFLINKVSWKKNIIKNRPTLFNMQMFFDYNDKFCYFNTNKITIILSKKLKDEILKKLIENDVIQIIESDNKYNHYRTCIKYYTNLDKTNKIKLTYKFLNTAINTYYNYNFIKLGKHKKMFDIQKKYFIDITKKEFINEISKKFTGKYLDENNEEKEIKYLEYIKRNLNIYYYIQKYNESYENERIEFFTVDNFSGRFHSPFTMLPSSIRKYIKKRNDILYKFDSEFDLKSCQLTLLADILKNKKLINNKNIFEIYNEYYKEEYVDDNFINIVENKDIYVKFGRLTDDNFNNNKREEYKKSLFGVIFGTVYNKDFIKFEQIFKNTARIIRLIKNLNLYNIPKKEKYKNLVKLLQLEEVRIFDLIWEELLKNKIDFVTIHDSIICNHREYNKVYKIIIKKLNEELNINFNLKNKIF
jgi:hypothetical protein